MRSQHLRLAAAGAAAIAAAALTACGSSAPSGTSGAPSPSASSAPAASTPTATFNATDVAFTTGMLRLESQARAVAGLVAGHTASTGLRGFAATVRADQGQVQQMSGMMDRWRRPIPPPYTPGAAPPAGMGPGMMSGYGWDEMAREHGSAFADHWVDVMIANRAAQIALCRSELRSGASPQARALARSILGQRQAQLTQLQGMNHDQEHHGDHD